MSSLPKGLARLVRRVTPVSDLAALPRSRTPLRRRDNLEGSEESREMAGGTTRRKERARPAVSALLALAILLARPGSASEKARSFTIHFAGGRARIVVPKKFEPLLPGSVYPNRRRPVPALGCPVVVVEKVAPLAASAEPFLLERGFLIAEMVKPDTERIGELAAELARHPEANAACLKLLVWKGSAAVESNRICAEAIFDPGDFPQPGGAETRCLPLAFFLRTPGRMPGVQFSARLSRRPDCVTEKWYRAEKDFPEEAFRDAAEWLAAAAR